MGGNLASAPDKAKAPNFMVYALRDPIGANLDRIQFVKVIKILNKKPPPCQAGAVFRCYTTLKFNNKSGV